MVTAGEFPSLLIKYTGSDDIGSDEIEDEDTETVNYLLMVSNCIVPWKRGHWECYQLIASNLPRFRIDGTGSITRLQQVIYFALKYIYLIFLIFSIFYNIY